MAMAVVSLSAVLAAAPRGSQRKAAMQGSLNSDQLGKSIESTEGDMCMRASRLRQ